jgi:hypothetical protein
VPYTPQNGGLSGLVSLKSILKCLLYFFLIEREQLAVQKELKAIMAGVLGKREVTFVKGSL